MPHHVACLEPSFHTVGIPARLPFLERDFLNFRIKSVERRAIFLGKNFLSRFTLLTILRWTEKTVDHSSVFPAFCTFLGLFSESGTATMSGILNVENVRNVKNVRLRRLLPWVESKSDTDVQQRHRDEQ